MCNQFLRFIFIVFLFCYVVSSVGIIYNTDNIYCCIYIYIADILAIYMIFIYIDYITEEYDKEYKNTEPINQPTTHITTDTKVDIK